MIEESSNKYGEIIPLTEVHNNILPIDLPMGYNYRFERFRTIDTVVIKFCAVIRVNIQDKLQAMDWLDKFQSVGYCVLGRQGISLMQFRFTFIQL